MLWMRTNVPPSKKISMSVFLPVLVQITVLLIDIYTWIFLVLGIQQWTQQLKKNLCLQRTCILVAEDNKQDKQNV